MRYQGKALDVAIEQELQLMLAEGYEKSPITPAHLHKRLKEKEIVQGSLSTLSKPHRVSLIKKYQSTQLDKANLKGKVRESVQSNRTLESYKLRLQQKSDEVESMKVQLDTNTQVLVDIILEVESKTPIKVENLLSPHLVNAKRRKV